MVYYLELVVEIATIAINAIALCIILYGAGMSVYALFAKAEKTPGIYIGENLDLGLRFLMVSEVLHTFTTESRDALINLGILLFLRIVMVIFNQKELQHETHQFEQELEACKRLNSEYEQCECKQEKE